MFTLDPTAFHAALDRRFGFVGFELDDTPARNFGGFTYKSPAELLKPITRQTMAARAALAAGGWSYRKAAKELGCSYQHLAHVLTGCRESISLLARIMALPKYQPKPR